ncbi:MAG TPA: hypothetical protein PKA54_03235 [Chitinophagaceae bacterium]|nr:MAG: hypothetical protein UZ11_BCD004001351 [Bacteroidetes bacterium OLB11]HMN32361.1 hypothetical protein [Chitinophagaceae bacterium]
MQAIVMGVKKYGIINEHHTKQFIFLIKQMKQLNIKMRKIAIIFEQLLFYTIIEERISMSQTVSQINQSLTDFKKEHQITF